MHGLPPGFLLLQGEGKAHMAKIRQTALDARPKPIRIDDSGLPFLDAVENRMKAKGCDRKEAWRWAMFEFTELYEDYRIARARAVLRDDPEHYDVFAHLEHWPTDFKRLAEQAPAASGDAAGSGAQGYGFVSPRELADVNGLNADALRKRLDRWRNSHADGWTEITERKRTEAQFLYRPASVADVIQKAIKATIKTSSKRPA